MSEILVRKALREELEAVNVLRKAVSELHVKGRPDVFRPDFPKELADRVYEQFDGEDSDVLVALAFYEAMGFETYRRYLSLDLKETK